MQPTEADNKKHKTPRDDENINFRPSPNFKHMKKYLKFKFEENSNSSPPNPGVDEQSEVLKMAATVQPPLPPNPPPESPPTLIPKKEIVDDEEYQCDVVEETAEAKPPEAVVFQPDEANKQSEKIMCRQFVRGTCTRGNACIYVHELILSQLPGVYTFCKNFQNTICTFPRCKFVHATVFEKEHFYRTGFLPPHTLAHLTQPPPPPPPPQPAVHEAHQSPAQPNIPNVPPPPPTLQMLNTGVPPTAMFTCPPAPYMENRHVNDIFGGALPANAISPIKREWAGIEEFCSTSSHNFDFSEPLTKKCKDCDVNDFRMQCCQNKVEKLTRSIDDMKKKILMGTKRNTRLMIIMLVSLFLRKSASDAQNVSNGQNASTSQNASNSQNVTNAQNATNAISTPNENYMVVIEQLRRLAAANNTNRQSLIDEENNKSLLNLNNLNLSTVMAMILLERESQNTPDSS